jgi:hypothetical protein
MPDRAVPEPAPAGLDADGGSWGVGPPRQHSDLPAADARRRARQMWNLFEPIHIISYFTPEPRQEFEAAGVRGFWRGYFAARAAPLGEVGAAPIIAAFFSFAPVMVARALPASWTLITPAEALAVRQAGAVNALRRLLDEAGVTSVSAAADRLAAAAADLHPSGHVLGAANGDLPVPDEPLARLWYAATVLREHRGDGHVAALVAADLDGAEALALRAGVDLAAGGAQSRRSGGWTRDQLQPMRGWTDEEWAGAAQRLAGRAVLRPDGTATAAGTELYAAVEEATDQAAARPWSSLAAESALELAELLRPIARACAAALPFPHPAGAPDPAPR